jgi:N-acetyl-alpha-D-muramate 1-phosphate uridylyltransferase
MKGMLLAAGHGTRMGALTERTPKPLLRIGRESLLERHVRRLARAGVRDIVVNTARNGEQIRAAIGDGSRWDVRVQYSAEGDEPLETGGGIVQALPLLGPDPFLLVNADIHTDFDFSAARLERGEGLLILVPNPAHHPDGDFGLDGAARVSPVPPRLTFSGISVLAPTLFAGLTPGRRPLKPVLDTAIARGTLFGRRFDGLWIDVGTPERLEIARAAAVAARE